MKTCYQPKRKSGLAIASLVLGIIGVFGSVCAVLALIFGAVALHKINRYEGLNGKGMAIAGIVLGIIGTLMGIMWIGLFMSGLLLI